MEITLVEIKCIFPLIKKELHFHFRTPGKLVSTEFHKNQGDISKILYSGTATLPVNFLF